MLEFRSQNSLNLTVCKGMIILAISCKRLQYITQKAQQIVTICAVLELQLDALAQFRRSVRFVTYGWFHIVKCAIDLWIKRPDDPHDIRFPYERGFCSPLKEPRRALSHCNFPGGPLVKVVTRRRQGLSHAWVASWKGPSRASREQKWVFRKGPPTAVEPFPSMFFRSRTHS